MTSRTERTRAAPPGDVPSVARPATPPREARRPRRGPLRMLARIVRGALGFVGQIVLIAYLLVSRSALVLGAIYLVLYFLAGSRPVKDVVQQAVSDAIPGSITAASIQWGPLPWDLRIADGRIFDETGRETIRVRAVDAHIDLGATIPGLVDFVMHPETAPMRVRIDDVDLLEPLATIRVTADGHVNIERAFRIDGWPPGAPPSDGGPVNLDITAATVRVIDGAGRVEAPGMLATGSGCDTVSDYALTGDVHMAFVAELVRLAEAEVRLDFVPFQPGPVRIPVRDLVVDDYRWRELGFSWGRARARLGADGAGWGSFEARGSLDAEPEVARWTGEARVHLDRDAPVTAALTGGAIGGALDLDVKGGGDVEQVAVTWALSSPRLGVGPLALDEVQAHGRILPRGADASGYYHDVLVDFATGGVDGPDVPGRVTVKDLVYAAPPPGPWRDIAERDLQLAFEVSGLDGPTLAPLVARRAAASLAPWVAGRWDARGTLSQQHAAGGVTTTEVELEQARFVWQAPHAALDGTYDLAGALRLVTSPRHSELALERVVVDRGEDRARLAGTIDLTSGVIDLEPYLRVGDVAGLSERLGLPRAGGRFVLKAARASGTLADPRVAGVLNWTDASLDGHRLEQLRADLELKDGVLRVTNARSTSGLGELALDGQVRLDDPRLAFETTRLDVSRLTLGALLAELGPDVRVDLRATRLTGALTEPLTSLRGRARLVLTDLIVGGEPIQSLEADLEADGDTLTLRRIEVRTRAGTLGGEVAIDLATSRLRGRVDVTALDVAALSGVARATPELAARLGAHLGISGTLARPTFIGTIDLGDVRWDDIRLGDAQLAVQTLPDGKVDLSALDQTFFRGLSLERAELTLDGFVPRRLGVAIRATDLALAELVPALRNESVAVTATALAELDVALGPTGSTSARVSAAPGDLRLALKDRDQVWTNTTALALERTGDQLALDPVGLGPRGQPAALELCGRVGRTLDMLVAGRIELAFIPGLADLFAVTEGRFVVAGPAASAGPTGTGPGARRRDAEDGSDRCLATREALTIGGTPDAPALAGRLVADDVVLVPRGSGRQLRLTDGSSLVLVPGGRGARQVIELPADGGLRGELDDGTFALTGRVELAGFRPAAIELDLTGTDLFLQSPGEYAITASPRGHLSVRDLDGASPSARLTGALAISEGRYSKSFDTIAQAIGGAAGTRADAYSASLASFIPWLSDMRLDIDVTAADFQIQTALPLAKTDLPSRLDLSLGGTFDEPLLYRRIDLLPGGTLTYFVFERAFQVTQGAIDFDGDAEHPLVDVTARTQVTYLARASTASLEEDEKEVTITLRMSGRVPDLKIELSADDGTLDQADVQSLLLTGKPRGDLDRAQESRVVSADLANLLNTVLSAPFVKTASVALNQQGALEYRVGTCFAPNLCFDTTTVADDTETTLRAKFSLSIGDDVVCEGALRRSDASTTSAQETYEARCRYRIPLE